MTLAQTILITMASLALVKSLIVFVMPEKMLSLARHYLKNEKAIRKISLIGIIVAAALFLIANLISF